MTQVRALKRLASALFVLTSSCVRQQIADSGCDRDWAPSRTLEVDDGRPAYVEAPKAIGETRGILLLGAPAFQWAARDSFDPPPSSRLDTAAYVERLRRNHGLLGFIVDSRGLATPEKLPGSTPMRRVVGERDLNNRVHVAWYGPPRESSDDDVEGTVWYSERGSDGWSAPLKLFSADRLDWSGQKPVMLTSGDSDVHLFATFNRGQKSGIAYVRRISGVWTTTEVPLRGLPSQAAGVLVGTDSIVVVFAGIGVPGVKTVNGQHLFEVRAARTDMAWPQPRLVHWSGLDAVRWTKLYTLAQSPTSQRLVLLWARIPREREAAVDTVFTMLSDDAGVTWVPGSKLSLPFALASLTQDIDTSRRIHIIATTANTGMSGVAMYHAVFDQNRWSSLLPIHSGTIASRPAISALGSDSLLLVWGETHPANSGATTALAPASKYTFFVGRCSRAIRQNSRQTLY